MNKFHKKLTINVSEEPEQSLDEPIPTSKLQPVDKQSLLQFRDYRDGVDSEGGETRQEHPSNKINYVEFQQFNVNRFDPRETLKTEGDHKKTPKHKRNFTIEVPDRDGDKAQQWKMKNISGQYEANEEFEAFKQPPAPSKGSKLNKVFVFPNSPQKMQAKYNEHDEILEDYKKSFERQRKEFYKEKSRLEKQILIKNGQIDMLQKIVKQKYTFEGNNEKRYRMYGNEDNFEKMENVLLQKDEEINQLLEKIAYLSDSLAKKNDQYNKKLAESCNLSALVKSLSNQLYIYEKKDTNEKITKKFYFFQKQKQREKIRAWDEDDSMNLTTGHIDYGRKGIQQLNKRIQVIRHNRKEINSRHKINSQYSSYSQSTKNRPKGAFDFKGKVPDGEKLNKTRVF